MRSELLEKLRDPGTPLPLFRRYSDQLFEEKSREVAQKYPPPTPIILIPILRAGLALLPPFIHIFPGAPVGVLGIRREETTALPQLYYENLPPLSSHDSILILDPMIATGGSLTTALTLIRDRGGNLGRTRVIGLLAAPEGLQRLEALFPEVEIEVEAIDRGLDSRFFIVPGLGDFGDRYFGTKPISG